MVLNLRQFSLRFLVICTSRYEYVKEYYIKWGKFSLFTYFTHSAYFSSYISSCNKTLYARVVSQYHCYQINHYLLTYLLPYSMEQIRPWEPNQFSASQEIPRILWKLKFYYCIHNCPPSLPILSQLHIVYTPTSHFLKIHLNIILPSTPGSTKWLWTFRNKIRFYGEALLALRPTPQLDDHTLSAVRDCLFNIFAATVHTVPPPASGGRAMLRWPRPAHHGSFVYDVTNFVSEIGLASIFRFKSAWWFRLRLPWVIIR